MAFTRRMLLGGAKIVAAGGSDAGGAGQFALARYDDTDGTLDSTFGSGGKVLTRFPASLGDAALAVSLQPHGKIVVAGGSGASESSSAFSLARYDSNGTLDASFGTGGTVTTAFGARRRAHPCDLAEAVGVGGGIQGRGEPTQLTTWLLLGKRVARPRTRMGVRAVRAPTPGCVSRQPARAGKQKRAEISS